MTVQATAQQAYAIGEAMHKRALHYAALTGTAIDLVMVTGANAKEEYKMTAGKLRASILANLPQEEVDALPYPGSRWKNPDGSLNNNPDIYEYKDPSKGADAKAREISFYVEWADNTPEGKIVVQHIDWIKRLSSKNMKTDDIPAEFQKQYGNAQLLDERLKYLEGRRGTIRTAYKDAVRLIWQIDSVNELVIYEPVLEDGQPVLNDDGSPKVTDKIVGGCRAEMAPDGLEVLVEDRADRRNYKFYSVGSFLKLNPLAALEQGGSWHALKATEKREGGSKDKNKNKTGVAGLSLNSVQTPESSDKVAAVWFSYLDKAMNNRASPEYAALLKHLTSDAGKQAVLTMGGLRSCLNQLFMIDQIMGIYEAEKAKLPRAA